MTITRRKQLLTLLKESSSAINGQQLADHFHVTRQIIVQDIAILRADGEEIISTNRGYIHSASKQPQQMHRLFKVKHTIDDIEEELVAIVDNGGRVKTVLVDHPVYGEIQTLLKMTCRRDIVHFTRLRSGNSIPLPGRYSSDTPPKGRLLMLIIYEKLLLITSALVYLLWYLS